MLGQRRRRWTNIESTLDERVVFAGRLLCNYINPVQMYYLPPANEAMSSVGHRRADIDDDIEL